MITFFKSDLFRNFLGGFVLGTVLVFTFSGGDDAVARDSGRPAASSSLS